MTVRRRSLSSPVVDALLVAAIAAVAFGFRAHDIDKRSLWLDEGYSFWYASQGLHYLWHVLPTYSVHPPYYYSLLSLWMHLGDSVAMLRMPSALAGAATMPFAYWLGGNVAAPGRRRLTGALTALCVATAATQIYYGQEARVYAFNVLAFTMALAGLTSLMRHPAAAASPWLGIAERNWRALGAWLALGVGTLMQLSLHHLGALYVAALTIAAVTWIVVARRGERPLLVNAGLVCGAVFVPWLPTLLMAVRATVHVTSGFWTPTPSRADVLQTIAGLLSAQNLGSSDLIYAAFLALAALGVWHTRRHAGWPVMLLLILATGVPLALNLILTFAVTPIFLARALLGIAVPFFALVAAGVTGWSVPAGRGTGLAFNVASAAVAALLVATLVHAADATLAKKKKTPWDRITAFVADEAAEDDAIVFLHNSTAFPFQYYIRQYDTRPAQYQMPGPFPDAGLEEPFDRQHIPDLLRVADKHPRVWVVVRAKELYDPAGQMHAALRDYRTERLRRIFGPVEVYHFE